MLGVKIRLRYSWIIPIPDSEIMKLSFFSYIHAFILHIFLKIVHSDALKGQWGKLPMLVMVLILNI